MKIKSIINAISTSVIVLAISTSAVAESYSEGIEYDVLIPEVATASENIEVRELFWYGCPHCYQLESPLRAWLKTSPKDVDFIKHPAAFSKNNWDEGAKFYYILRELEAEESLGLKLFSDWHDKGKNFNNTNLFVDWLKENGIPSEVADKYVKNFSIFVKASKAKRKTADYKISGVPTIVVDGKYKTSPSQAGSIGEMKNVLDFLIKKVRQERKQ